VIWPLPQPPAYALNPWWVHFLTVHISSPLSILICLVLSPPSSQDPKKLPNLSRSKSLLSSATLPLKPRASNLLPSPSYPTPEAPRYNRHMSVSFTPPAYKESSVITEFVLFTDLPPAPQYSIFFFFSNSGVELRALHLLGRCYTT
jgi:hypothetical protein